MAIGNSTRIGDWGVVELDTVQQASQWTVNTASTGADANDEYVDLLMLEEVSLNGWRIEMRDAMAAGTSSLDTPSDNPGSGWSVLYEFTAQNAVKAGMRIRLYSGGLLQPSGDHTLLAMNKAPQGNPGVAQLPSSGADLRLIDISGRIACAIRFLPETAFGPVPAPLGVRMLRNGDATGLILFPVSMMPSRQEHMRSPRSTAAISR